MAMYMTYIVSYGIIVQSHSLVTLQENWTSSGPLRLDKALCEAEAADTGYLISSDSPSSPSAVIKNSATN